MCYMDFKSYASCEDGAVAVNWVVLTSGVVGLAFATSVLIGNGMVSLSGNLTSDLGTQRPSPIEAVTAALTQTAFWHDPGAFLGDLRNVNRLSFATEVAFSSTDEGIIFETGGTGRGIILYQVDGELYLQAGSGDDFGETTSRGEASWTVSEGTHLIEGSLDADGGLALYVNGSVVDQSSFTAQSLAGGDPGSIGAGTNSVSRNRGGFDRNDPGHPGVTSVSFFEDQTTGDEVIALE